MDRDEIDKLAVEVLEWGFATPFMREAARELVGSTWLANAAFVEACIVRLGGQPPAAQVDWVAVDAFLNSRPTGTDKALAALRRATALGRRATALQPGSRTDPACPLT